MTPEEKIGLFLALFRGRPDVHARRVELPDPKSPGGFKTGYRPVHSPLGAAEAKQHLQGGAR